jgi:hypothetical protein
MTLRAFCEVVLYWSRARFQFYVQGERPLVHQFSHRQSYGALKADSS